MQKIKKKCNVVLTNMDSDIECVCSMCESSVFIFGHTCRNPNDDLI